LKYVLAIVGVVLLVVGIAGAVVSYSNVTAAALNAAAVCINNPISAECFSATAAINSAWTTVILFALLGVVGFIVMIVGLVMDASKGAAAPAPGMAPMAMAPPSAAPTATCPRCGRPARWVPQYQRWFCDAENAYV